MKNSANGDLNETDILGRVAPACLPNTKVLNRNESETRSRRDDERGPMIICRLCAGVTGKQTCSCLQVWWMVALQQAAIEISGLPRDSPWQNAYVERLIGIHAD